MATSAPSGGPKASARARNSKFIAASLAAAMMFGSMPAFGFLARPVIFAALGAVTKAPNGWLRFCVQNPEECRPTGEEPRDITLTPELLQQLFSINSFANDRVKWTSDAELYGQAERWTYPLDRGDCEDIVLLKRRLLAQAGWPLGNLLITIVDHPGAGGRHAVLTVRSDRGELILDNLSPEILFWYETPYRFLARQTPADPNVWVSFSTDQAQPGAMPAVR
jgi:predicted transglutaminase-like cysteine proteinase